MCTDATSFGADATTAGEPVARVPERSHRSAKPTGDLHNIME
jgi:hypothetical protein